VEPKLPARIDRTTFERLLQRAAELQAAASDIGEGVSEEELLALGKEVGIPEQHLRLVREAMWAVVNEAGGTASIAKLPAAIGAQVAGKTGTTQVRRVTREQRERGFNVNNMPREWRPHALFVAYAPHDNPLFAVSVVVEHGTSGGAAAAPLARDVLVEAFNRLRPGSGPPRVAQSARP